MRERCVQDREGDRSPLCQHSGMNSHGGVGRGISKKCGGFLDWWVSICVFILFDLLCDVCGRFGFLCAVG